MYTGLQSTLLVEAARLCSLGYKVGFAHNKKFISEYEREETVQAIFGPYNTIVRGAPTNGEEWDGISIIPEGVVCVDFDTPDFDVGWGRPLPPTLKERTPRGYHLYYSLPTGDFIYEPKIKFTKNVDLLVKGRIKKRYGGRKEETWGNHVVCHPTPGYKRIWPDTVPHVDDLPRAPDWIIELIQV